LVSKETVVALGALISFVIFMGLLPTFFYYEQHNVLVNTIQSISIGLTISFVIWWFIINERKPRDDRII